VIVGEEDAAAIDASRFLAATIPGATLKILPATGHTLNLEEPEAFNRHVREFLDMVSGAAGQSRSMGIAVMTPARTRGSRPWRPVARRGR
jgi:hypothetical protein